MTAFNLTEDQAITAITVGVDFSVSQVVNGNWGMQTIIPKVPIHATNHASMGGVHVNGCKQSQMTCKGHHSRVAQTGGDFQKPWSRRLLIKYPNDYKIWGHLGIQSMLCPIKVAVQCPKQAGHCIIARSWIMLYRISSAQCWGQGAV